MSRSRVPTLSFIGAARTVTGSKTLLETSSGRVLVDAGLFQGRRELRAANRSPFPIPPESIDAVVLTHAHIDHCGYLPRLVRDGFSGPIWCTAGTARLLRIVLPDSAYLQEEEAAYANRMGYSKHDPAEPLYTADDAQAALELVGVADFHQVESVTADVDVAWHRAGHILGAAWLRLGVAGVGDVVFSGDLGRPSHPILRPADPIGAADVVVVESTYGDEEHAVGDPDEALASVVRDAASCGGVVVVPAFAVDRTEVVLWHLDRLVAQGVVPDIPVIVDSPMALDALGAYRAEARRGSPEIRTELHGQELFSSLHLIETRTADQSKALNARRGPMVIISASGMATGGRVVHHLSQRIGDGRNSIVIVGFQAPGTRGDRLRAGATKLKMLGRYHPVRADVVTVPLSSHADRSELLDWLGTADTPNIVYVNHGEEDAALAMADAVERRLGIPAVAPYPGERVRLDPVG